MPKSLYFQMPFTLKLNIDEADNSLDIDLVMSTSSYYLISNERAEVIKTEVLKAIADWRNVAIKYKIPSSEIKRKANAFRDSSFLKRIN